jgi:cobalt-zinc-cadmium efflux system protein
MSHEHAHAGGATSERRLWWAFGLTGSFMLLEVVGGLLLNSLALLSDAAHMFTDVTALGIALAAIRIGRRPVDDRRSFGYQRFEILAAAFNTLLLFGVAAYIVVEGIQRFRAPADVHSTGMLLIALAGLIVNLISMRLLAGGAKASLNVKGAYLEVWSDLLGSVGVVVAAVAIQFTGQRWIDPAVAIAIGLWVLPRAWLLLKDTTNILLQGTPPEVDLAVVRAAIEADARVERVHDLHVWSLTSGRHVLTAHVVIRAGADGDALLLALTPLLRRRFELFHSTLQIEREACADLHAPATSAQPTPHAGDDPTAHAH